VQGFIEAVKKGLDEPRRQHLEHPGKRKDSKNCAWCRRFKGLWEAPGVLDVID
jgi:hypothetical protein